MTDEKNPNTDDDDVSATRAKFAEIITADDDEVKRMASAMHLGVTLAAMMDNLTEAAKEFGKMGMDTDNATLGTSTAITNKADGTNYIVSVTLASDEDVAQHVAALATARDLSEVGTDETKH